MTSASNTSTNTATNTETNTAINTTTQKKNYSKYTFHAGEQPDIDQELASDPATDPDILLQLWEYYSYGSKSATLAADVLRNPNVSMSVIHNVHGYTQDCWAEAILQNPAWTLWLLEDSDLLDHLESSMARDLLRRVTDASLLRHIMRGDNLYLLEAIIENPAAPYDVIQMFWQKEEWDTRETHIKSFSHPSLSPHMQQQLQTLYANQPANQENKKNPEHHNTVELETLQWALEQGPWLQHLALRSIFLPKEIYAQEWQRFLDTMEQFRQKKCEDPLHEEEHPRLRFWRMTGFADSPHVSSDDLRLLLESGDFYHMHMVIAKNPKSPIDVLWSLATSSEYVGADLLEAIAKNPLSADTVAENPEQASRLFLRLCYNQQPRVAKAAAKKSCILPEHQKRVDKLFDPKNKYTNTRKNTDKFTASDWDFYVSIQGVVLTSAVAEHPQAPPHVLEKLADHNSIFVRRALAKNPSASPEIIEKIKNKNLQDDVLQLNILSYQAKTPEQIAWYSEHLLMRWRKMAAMCAYTSTETLQKLSSDNEVDVRAAVATHENTNAATLLKLSADESTHVMTLAASHKNLPIDRAYELTQHIHRRICGAAVTQGRLLSSVVRNLAMHPQDRINADSANDGYIRYTQQEQNVRLAALSNWRLDQASMRTVWQEMIQGADDDDERIRQELERNPAQVSSQKHVTRRQIDFAIAQNLAAPRDILESFLRVTEQKQDGQQDGQQDQQNVQDEQKDEQEDEKQDEQSQDPQHEIRLIARRTLQIQQEPVVQHPKIHREIIESLVILLRARQLVEQTLDVPSTVAP